MTLTLNHALQCARIGGTVYDNFCMAKMQFNSPRHVNSVSLNTSSR